MSETYYPPKILEKRYTCPLCGVYAQHSWNALALHVGFQVHAISPLEGFYSSYCTHCEQRTYWAGERIIFPDVGVSEPASMDLSMDVRFDFDEARAIVNKSLRGAAALLRLALQKLCAELGQSGKNINDDIKAMVASGLPVRVQQALDAVRVIGNEAVHPGELDLRDDRATAFSLFRLINFIAEKMITEPKEMDDIYAKLPESKREAIEKRDATSARVTTP